MIVVRHSRVEVLTERLKLFLGSGGDPFTPERLLVESAGIERWAT